MNEFNFSINYLYKLLMYVYKISEGTLFYSDIKIWNVMITDDESYRLSRLVYLVRIIQLNASK